MKSNIELLSVEEKDNFFMEEAIKEAKKAYAKGEVPVGAVIVYNDEIISRAHNTRHETKNAIEHAEIKAIQKANKKLNSWMLDNCVLYVTLEPCIMCAGAIYLSRVRRIVYSAKEPKFGAFGSVLDLKLYDDKFNHHVDVTNGVLEDKTSNIMKQFFKELRQSKNKQ